MYLAAFHSRPVIKEVHLGGGTPTFFSAGNLRKLMEGLLKNATLAEDHEFGFEGHSNNTTEEHLKTLADLGFTRVSFGVQDFNDEVQQIINRKQSFEQINRVVQLAKKHGFSSINIDLLYGLPKQTAESIMNTIEKTISLRPTRIALYGYAHIPWIKAAQKSFEQWLPTPGERLEMYELGKKMLAAENYIDIGMDHFALSSDKLYQAFDKGQLHRNFMGYTTQESDLLIGLGMSAISDTWVAFSQNEKLLSKYYQRLDRNEFPIFRGHQLTREDLVIRKHILNLMSRFSTRWDQEELLQLAANYNLDLLEDLASDGLISWNGDGIKVLEAGKPYIRNICMTLDAHLWRTKKLSRFCQTV